MPPAIKNEAANEMLSRADALMAEIANPDVKLTKDELDTKMQGVTDYRRRAQMLAELDPEKMAEENHDLIKLDVSDDGEPEQGPSYKEASEMVTKAFGGPGRYILAQAQMGTRVAKPWSPKQRKAHELLQRAIVGTASDASGGEFLLPLTQHPDAVVAAAILQPGLFERAPKYACPGRTTRIPYLVQDDADDTRPLSSIAATGIVGEGSEKPERTPTIAQRLVTAYKWAAYTEAADEMLEDDYTGQLPALLRQAVGGDLTNSMNLAITRSGSGSSAPLGALHSNNGALITVNRETSQTVTITDVLTMLSKSTMGPGSFFLAHVGLMPAIYGLALSSGSQVTFLQNLREGPGAQLFGLPLVWSHLPAVKGVAGDLSLLDPSQYAAVLRRQVTMESSIHYKFQNDVTAYRFFCRAGGAPIPSAPYSFSATGGVADYTYSGFVQLGDDVTS